MSIKVFQDNVFPRHVSDVMNIMHMVVFNGTDGEESWPTYLSLKQKEYIALGLAQYYQCHHCIDHHTAALCRIDKQSEKTLCQNVVSMILFLRIDTRTVSESEKNQWLSSWKRFSHAISVESGDEALPYLMGLAIGIARNDDFLIEYCGTQVRLALDDANIPFSETLGELEAVVIFMKAAASKNRVIEKIAKLIDYGT